MAKNKIKQALDILIQLGLPKGQQNERSALALLALSGIKKTDDWQQASSSLIGITPIMDFAKEFYKKRYAPNSRETFRRFTIHQFVEAGIAVLNPDKQDRPINSPKCVYQIEPEVLKLLKSYDTSQWNDNLSKYLKTGNTLAQKYAKEREMQMIPVVINKEKKITLSPGDHSELIKKIIEEFAPGFAPGAEVLYVGDTGSKLTYFEETILKELGLFFDDHGKFPDVVLYFRKRNWLLLVEAVTSHGPVDSKRHAELSFLFSKSKAPLVFVTVFPDRQIMARYLPEISWETEVWVADSPSHLIHFNGERFLGPYCD